METIFLNDKIEKLNISNRLRNVLRRTGIDTVEKLIQFPEDEWPGLPNIGSKTLDEIFSLIDS